MAEGFNYAYRRSATTAATPVSTTSNAQINAQVPSTSGTPTFKAQPYGAPKSNGPSVVPTPPPQQLNAQQLPEAASGAETPKEATPVKTNGTATPLSPIDKLEAKQKSKKEKKKEKQEQSKDKDGAATDSALGSASGKATPVANASESADKPGSEWEEANPWSPSGGVETPLSAGRDSPAGIRTPTHKKPARNPWTLFMRFTAQVTDADMREFFGDARSGVSITLLLT